MGRKSHENPVLLALLFCMGGGGRRTAWVLDIVSRPAEAGDE